MATLDWQLEGDIYAAPGTDRTTSYVQFHQGTEIRGKRRVITLHSMTGTRSDPTKAIKWATHQYLTLPLDTPKEVIAAWKSVFAKDFGITRPVWQTWVDRVKQSEEKAAGA